MSNFFSSQAFYISLGCFLTAGFTWFIEWRKSEKDNEIHIRENRENTYLEVLDVLMLCDKYCRSKKDLNKYRNKFNNLQAKMMLYAPKRIYDKYYKLINEINMSYEKSKDKNLTSNENSDKIEKFSNELRKNLNIEGEI